MTIKEIMSIIDPIFGLDDETPEGTSDEIQSLLEELSYIAFQLFIVTRSMKQ